MAYRMLTLRIPPKILEEINSIAKERGVERSEVIREAISKGVRETRIERVIEQYKKGRISLERAAELSGFSLREIFQEFKRRGVTIHYSKERLLKEAESL